MDNAGLQLNKQLQEKLLIDGARTLSDAEVIALLIGSSSKKRNALELANEIIRKLGIAKLKYATLGELTAIRGISTAKAAKLLACAEFSKRADAMYIKSRKIKKISCAEDAICLCKNLILDCSREHVIAILLSPRNNVLSAKVLTVGTNELSVAEPKDALHEALIVNAASIIMLHNHPSGECMPSNEDIRFTLRLKELCNIANIRLLDHIIISSLPELRTDNPYFSFKENKLI